MKIKVTENPGFSLIEICNDNGRIASAKDYIDESTELQDIYFPVASGKLAVIAGLCWAAHTVCVAHYKSDFEAIALVNSRPGVALIVHSTTPDYKVGQDIPSPVPVHGLGRYEVFYR